MFRNVYNAYYGQFDILRLYYIVYIPKYTQWLLFYDLFYSQWVHNMPIL